MSLDIVTRLLYHGGKRNGKLAKLTPACQVRFDQEKRSVSVHVPTADGTLEPARFGYDCFGDVKIPMDLSMSMEKTETEIHAFICFTAALTGKCFRKITHKLGEHVIVYEVVEPEPEPKRKPAPKRRRRSPAPVT
jgi:hypothetical protein